MNNFIEIHNLVKKYGKETILNNVNLTLKKGEIIGLIGPSGAGKTTTIKTALGMEKADSGSALVLGKQMPNRKILGEIGYMAQSDALYTSLTGAENLEFFGEMKGVAKKDIAEQIEYVAEVVDLTDALDKYVKEYSGGMMRRLSLAIALLSYPKLLVLDEPTVGIDPALRRKIWHELNNLRSQGCSVLITTHVMDEAEKTDCVALLLHGEIIAFDHPQVLEQNYGVPTIEDVFLKAEQKEGEK